MCDPSQRLMFGQFVGSSEDAGRLCGVIERGYLRRNAADRVLASRPNNRQDSCPTLPGFYVIVGASPRG
jgi:hypothetical protein